MNAVAMSEPSVASAAVNKDGRMVGKEDGKIGGYRWLLHFVQCRLGRWVYDYFI